MKGPQAAGDAPGSGYMAAVRFTGPDGEPASLLVRSEPGLPHPEWQLQRRLESIGVAGSQVVELYTELEPCALPGGYCAALILRSWPRVKVTHSIDFRGDWPTRLHSLEELAEHARQSGARTPAQDGGGTAADAASPTRPAPDLQLGGSAALEEVKLALVEAFGAGGVRTFTEEDPAYVSVSSASRQVLATVGVPVVFPPFFRLDAVDQPVRDDVRHAGIGSDFGRRICIDKVTDEVTAVGSTQGDIVFVNSDVLSFVRALTALRRTWTARRGLAPAAADVVTGQLEAFLTDCDPRSVAGPETWWSTIVQQMRYGLL
ncbi:nucleic acid/nucleotide deaminase domain-containing protein [Streptomyces sp. NPDC059639]|uniref:nucleic acid/nucleotide deaminase domain-containing protein n=1 Tax=Streptomyces sp. NPDC059639 TaxID=3346891 RepID=UPI0036C115A8